MSAHALCVSGFDGTNFVDLLRWRAAEQPDRVLFTELPDGERTGPSLTCAELDRAARALAAQLAGCTEPGDRALLLYPGGLDFVTAFFGCLYAGVIAVPAYPPDPTRLERTLPRLTTIAADARPAIVLTTGAIAALREPLAHLAPALAALPWLATDGVPHEIAGAWRRPEMSPDHVALLQYTSGSTATPKGVIVTHGNLFENERMICEAFEHRPSSVGVSWLPVFHDMGLMGHILQPVYLGAHNVLLSPLAFLQRPHRWLQAISDYGATTSGAPNFAFELCARRVTAEQRESIDLGTWRVAYCGAEPISPDTLERFAQAFAPCGFRRAALYPCYGMAEATLIVSGGRAAEPPVHLDVDPDALGRNEVHPPADGAGRRLVGCGRALLAETITIVDPETGAPCAAGRVGEIWVAGTHVATGYWELPEETAYTFGGRLAGHDGTFLRTGDLGFVHEGELYVTGRLKDVIIVRGRNYYPQDIERTVATADPSLRPGSGAAFGLSVRGEERVVVAQEVRSGRAPGDASDVVARIAAAVTAEHGLQLQTIVLLEPGAIPKTSSGKICRRACRDLLAGGALPELHRWERGRKARGASGASEEAA
jgi:acyl-CoA synthetase (AMP-forming)/AMP-acid ligase II